MTGEIGSCVEIAPMATIIASMDPLRHQNQNHVECPVSPSQSPGREAEDGGVSRNRYRPPHIRSAGSITSSPISNSANTPGSIRPRSLFTSQSHSQNGNGGNGLGHDAGESYSTYIDYPIGTKYSRPGSREWLNSQQNGSNYEFYNNNGVNRGSGFSPVYFNENSCDTNYWSGDNEDTMAIGATVTSQGVISVRLHSGVQVDITTNKGIRVLNHRSQIIIAVSPSGTSSAVVHPSGRVYAYGSRVEISTTDCNGNSKFAKMFYKGVSFTSDTSALTYLVDQAGTRTTSDTFSDMNGDFSIPVFLSDAAYGPTFVRECANWLRQAQYWVTEDGIENWVINGIRISQTPDGLVRVGRGTSKYQIRTSPLNGTVTLTTPFVHTTASVGSPTPMMGSGGPHLFVKRGERRLHSDGLTFIVRNAGHASGFDEFNQLKVY